jgi:hypothetical protein
MKGGLLGHSLRRSFLRTERVQPTLEVWSDEQFEAVETQTKHVAESLAQ